MMISEVIKNLWKPRQPPECMRNPWRIPFGRVFAWSLITLLLLCFSFQFDTCAWAQGKITRFFPLRSFDETKKSRYPACIAEDVFYDGKIGSRPPWLEWHIRHDSRQRRKAAHFRYNVSGGYVGYYIRLFQGRRIQYSRYNALQFWIKGNLDHLKIELKGTGTHVCHLRTITEDWQRVVIPFSRFSGADDIDYQRLEELVFVVSGSRNSEKEGRFSFDDIGFVYYKKPRLKVRVRDCELLLNGLKAGENPYFHESDIIIDARFQGSSDINNTDIRFEVKDEEGPWFLVDQRPVDSLRGTGYWDAGYYPSGSYRLRCSLVRNNSVLYTSPIIGLDITNDFDEKKFIKKILADTYQYFHHEYHPEYYLTKDRSGEKEIISTGACGFALTVYPLAAERGFLTQDQARKRVNAVLDAYLNAVPSIHGFYQHWFDFDFNPVFEEEGCDAVETSYLAAGALFCKHYYDGNTQAEKEIRNKAGRLIQRINWPFMLARPDGDSGRNNPLHWLYYKKDDAFRHPIMGFNECLITYVMALASPRPISKSNFKKWYGRYSYKKYYKQKVVFYPTLFTQHYSFMWLDPRRLSDRWVDYFTNAQTATLINREFSLHVPRTRIWGLTSCDGPDGYAAYGVDLPFVQSRYDGTFSPSASLGSLPFTPAPVIANLRRIYTERGELAYGPYGFYDSFNSDKGWSSRSYLGITQGVIYLQIENYLDQRVWKTFMQNRDICRALRRAGFRLAEG